MALSFCFCHSNLSLKIDYPRLALRPPSDTRLDQRSTLPRKGLSTEGFSQQVTRVGTKLGNEWSFVGGSRIIVRPRLVRFVLHRRSSGVYASWWASSQIASNIFTLGTVAVLPFYTLMVFAPKAELTKKCMQSSIPYAVLGILYAYVLYLSWTPETMQLMFASKYWLPELPGIARMFSNEMTLASAWIHLLAVDLFAARQVFQDGLNNRIETRHSVSLCLLFCPVGIFTHFITAALTKSARSSKHIM